MYASYENVFNEILVAVIYRVLGIVNMLSRILTMTMQVRYFLHFTEGEKIFELKKLAVGNIRDLVLEGQGRLGNSANTMGYPLVTLVWHLDA